MSVLYLSMQCWCRPHTPRCHLASVWAEALLCPSGAAQLSSAGPGLLLGRTRSCGWRSIDVKAALLSPGWAALYSPLLYRHSTLYTLLLPAATASACHLNWLHNITGCTSVLHHPALDIVKLANQGGELGDDGEIVLRCQLWSTLNSTFSVSSTWCLWVGGVNILDIFRLIWTILHKQETFTPRMLYCWDCEAAAPPPGTPPTPSWHFI